MHAVFRSALFPLIVIVLLVYLASQTLLGEKETTVPYSLVVQSVSVNPKQIDRVVLQRDRGVVVERVGGARWKATNPNEASQLELERLLVQQGVTYEWESSTGPAWWSLLTALLPFVLLMAFWLALRRHPDERAPTINREAA